MIHFIRLLIGLVTLVVLTFTGLVIYTLFMKFGILFIMAIAVLVVAYWIGNAIFDI